MSDETKTINGCNPKFVMIDDSNKISADDFWREIFRKPFEVDFTAYEEVGVCIHNDAVIERAGF